MYDIVLQAEATIDIHSRPGAGTTFTILIPTTDEVAMPVEQEATSQRTPTGVHLIGKPFSAAALIAKAGQILNGDQNSS